MCGVLCEEEGNAAAHIGRQVICTLLEGLDLFNNRLFLGKSRMQLYENAANNKSNGQETQPNSCMSVSRVRVHSVIVQKTGVHCI